MNGTGLEDHLAIDYLRLIKDGQRPIMLCDVDGVLRVPGAPEWPEPPRIVAAHGRTIKYAPSLIDWIRDLIVEPAVDFVWCTTWNGRTHMLCDVWDLPLPNAEASTRTTEAWNSHLNGITAMVMKLTVLQAAIDTGRPVIHLDDHVALHFASDRYLAIRPDTVSGLTPEHMHQVASFIKQHQ